ncbi:MAG: hypothetical protein ACI86S_002710, partial [Paracoccaceae bacterium]
FSGTNSDQCSPSPVQVLDLCGPLRHYMINLIGA